MNPNEMVKKVEAACDMSVRITEPGFNIIKPPAVVDCGDRAICKWFLVDADEKFIREEGELVFTGTLTEFTVKLSTPGIFKYLVMKVLGKPDVASNIIRLNEKIH